MIKIASLILIKNSSKIQLFCETQGKKEKNNGTHGFAS